MPKCYSDEEKENIQKKLKIEAKKCMEEYGIKKTTVDELVKRANIPKGTFYLFYPSKEMLLYEVILELHDKINRELYEAALSIVNETNIIDSLTEVLYSFYEKASKEPILKLINSSEIEIFYKKLPREVIEKHINDDNDELKKVFSLFELKEGVDYETINAACHEIYYTTLQREHLENMEYKKALKMLIKGIIIQVIK